jgi:uncharacterized protein YdaU (DUF1376 family)
MDMRGHNSAAYGQTISEFGTATIERAPKKTGRFPFFKFYPRDWLEATREMSLEERGAYIDLICILMEMEGHLADNDDWMRHQLHIPKQRWKKMKNRLVEHGKIRIENGLIVNERCIKELDDLLSKRTQNSRNVQKRWKKVGEKLEESSNKVETFSKEKSEKPNKINDCHHSNVPVRARVLDSDLDLDKEISPNGLLIMPSEKPRAYSQSFEDFWKAYPRRVGKGKAYSAWKRLNGPDRKKAAEQLVVQLPALLMKLKDERGNFCPHGATWLSQRRFDDEPEVQGPSLQRRATRDPNDMSLEEYRAYCERI